MRSPLHRSAARERHLDAVSFLTVYIVLVLGIESRWVVAPLGGAGTPAQVLAMAGLGWWLYWHVQRTRTLAWQRQPVRIAAFVLFLAYMASFVVAMSRPIDNVEFSSANLGMVGLLGWLGLVLLANDGIPSYRRFDALAHRLVVGGALVGALGVAQFIFHDPLIRWISWPGLATNLPLGDLMSRAGFTRPSGTALHPIEYGAVVTTILPVAIARARGDLDRHRWLAWLAVFLIALGVVVSGSRSAILSSLTGLVVLAVVWGPRTRAKAAVAVGCLLVFVSVAFPGMAGTLFKLFSGFSEDGSIHSRTGSYTVVGEFVSRSPVFGRGASTFLPSYRILDNQYLVTLIEVGVVGLIAFLGILFSGMWCARAASRRAPDRARAELAQSFAAAIASAAIGLGTYDGLSFPMGTGVLFLVIGMSGAVWRLVREEEGTESDASRLDDLSEIRSERLE